VRNAGKRSVLGVLIDAVDYDAALDFVFTAVKERRGAAVSAIAVHGVMTGVLDPEQKFRLNHFDLLVPDGQPVRWVLNGLHRAKLANRVYGPTLTLRICELAVSQRVPLYFYGSTPSVLRGLCTSLIARFPGLKIAGAEPSRFRSLTPGERRDIIARIRSSGAGITLVGLGCPRQEMFAYELRDQLSMPVIAIGAAFPFIAGLIPQAPEWMQNHGLEWLFRLISEPRRLWKRYLFLNPLYVFLICLQSLRLWRFSTEGTVPHCRPVAG